MFLWFVLIAFDDTKMRRQTAPEHKKTTHSAVHFHPAADRENTFCGRFDNNNRVLTVCFME
jgi:hypothetical protein